MGSKMTQNVSYFDILGFQKVGHKMWSTRSTRLLRVWGTPKSWFLTPFLTPFWTIYRNMPTFAVQRIPVLFRVCQKGVKKWLKTMNFGPRGPKMWQPIKMDFLRGVQKWGHFWRPFLNTTFRNHQWFSEKRSQFWSRGCQKVTHFLTLFWTPWFCNKQR